MTSDWFHFGGWRGFQVGPAWIYGLLYILWNSASAYTNVDVVNQMVCL